MKKIYNKWFLSYLVILTLPIILGFFIYCRSLKNSQEQAELLNESLMTMVKNEFDHQIEGAIRQIGNIAFDQEVQILSANQNRDAAQDQYMMYSLNSNLKNIALLDQYCSDIFVYLKNTNMIVSSRGNMLFDLFYELYYDHEEQNPEQFKEYLMQFHFGDMMPVKGRDGKTYLLFTMTSLKSDVGENLATIGIRIDIKKLKELFESAKWNEQNTILVVDNSNKILYSTDESLIDGSFSQLPDYQELHNKERFYSDLKQERYMGVVIESSQIKCKYIILTPVYLVEKSAKEIQRFSILGLFLCIFLGALLSSYLAKKNYHPLAGLVSIFKNQGTVMPESQGNEYQWLTEQSKKFFQEHTDIKRMLAMNKKMVKDYQIFKLLESPQHADRKNLEANINLTGRYHLVILFAVSEPITEPEDMPGLCNFIIKNIMSEALAEYFNVEMTEVGVIVAGIINIPDENPHHIDQIKEIIDQVHLLISEHFQFDFVTLMGDIHAGLEGIHQSYQEAREAEEYIRLLDTDLVLYHEIKNIAVKYYYPIETEWKIINAIKGQDDKNACLYINEIFDKNYQEHGLSADIYKCLIFDMMGTMMKGADEGGCRNFFEDNNCLKGFSVKLPMEEIKTRFHDIVKSLCNEIEQMKVEYDQKLSEQIMQYIEENYADPDLNISQAGFHFQMSPAYISAVFKNQTGKSLLKQINTVRIRKSQELLEQGFSVVETAQKVGFRSSGAYIRVFKQFIGTTPGQVKKSH